MAVQDTYLCKAPNAEEKRSIITTCFGLVCGEDGVKETDFDEYFTFYLKETRSIFGAEGQDVIDESLYPVYSHRQIVKVIEILQTNLSTGCREDARCQIRADLSLPRHINFAVEDWAIDLALRLWLMINFRDPKNIGEGEGRTCIEWPENSTLLVQCESLFPKSVIELAPNQRRMHPNFKAVNMENIYRLNIKWTSSLEDHLYLDREQNTLWVFRYRRFLQLRDRKTQISAYPMELINETSRTLDLLFPSWDRRTKQRLGKEKLDFHRVGFGDRSLELRQYSYWRDRLLMLYEDVYLAPPEGWAQLWYDRRDPQKFWTFWVAFIVLILTILSTIATLLQTVLALRQS